MVPDNFGRRPDGSPARWRWWFSWLRRYAGLLKAKGRGLALPALPLTSPVRAQLQSRTGACWDAVYSLPRKNDVTKFNAKSD